MDFRPPNREAPHIDAIQLEDGVPGREAPTGRLESAPGAPEDLRQAEALGQQKVSFVAPVIEVAGDDQRQGGLDLIFKVAGQSI